MSPNLKAFLGMIGVSELGKALIACSDGGYNVIVGSTAGRPDLFTSYADHPRKLVSMVIRGKVVKSTAAGKYQILERYFDHYSKQLGLPDFSPASQDCIALQLIRECRAINDIEAGLFDVAAHKCRSRWASLPGAGYGQHENKIADLRAAFVEGGGRLA